jgi:membrane protein
MRIEAAPHAPAARAYNASMARTAWVLLKQVFRGYNNDNASQLAAAISYFVLFSIIPLAIFAVSVFSLVLGEGAREDIVDAILDAVPLTQTEGRDAVEEAFSSARAVSGPVAVFAFLATLWTASNVFGSIRRALNIIWHGEGEPRPFVQGKLVDFLQVGVLTAILVLSMVLTGVIRTVREISADQFGPLANESPLWELPSLLLPALISFATFVLLYHIVPAVRPNWRDVLPGALVATLLFELLKNSFAIYVANFNNFDVVYGSLAGALLFLFYTYLSANILLIGALVSRVWERYRTGALDAEIHPAPGGPTFTEQAVRAVKGLFVRQG